MVKHMLMENIHTYLFKFFKIFVCLFDVKTPPGNAKLVILE